MEEEVFGDYVTEMAQAGLDPTTAPEAVLPSGTADPVGVDAYDFKEYDLKEYDVTGLDKNQYEYGPYDEFGNVAPNPPSNYEDSFGQGVAAETDIAETEVTSDVSIDPQKRVSSSTQTVGYGNLACIVGFVVHYFAWGPTIIFCLVCWLICTALLPLVRIDFVSLPSLCTIDHIDHIDSQITYMHTLITTVIWTPWLSAP